MSLTELFIIAVGLSMDAFAVAVCKGLAMPRMSWKGALKMCIRDRHTFRPFSPHRF